MNLELSQTRLKLGFGFPFDCQNPSQPELNLMYEKLDLIWKWLFTLHPHPPKRTTTTTTKGSFPGSSLTIDNCEIEVLLGDICSGDFCPTLSNTQITDRIWTRIQSWVLDLWEHLHLLQVTTVPVTFVQIIVTLFLNHKTFWSKISDPTIFSPQHLFQED